MALADYQGLVPNLVRDEAGKVSTGQRDEAIALAVERYSKDRPRLPVADVTAAGGSLLDLPAGWQDGFSRVVTLEHPVGSYPPAILDGEAWGMYRGPSGADKIGLVSALPAGAVVRVTFTARHTVSADADTIPVRDREPVACWAAAVLLDQLAALYSGDRFSTIQSDSVDHGGKGRDYAARAAALRKRYLDELGLADRRTAPAGTVVATRPRDSLGSTQRLTHPGAHR